MDGENNTPCTSTSLQVNKTDLAQSQQVYEPRITSLLKKFDSLILNPGQLTEVVSVKDELNIALRSWKDVLRSNLGSYENSASIAGLIKRADEQTTSCETKYQEYTNKSA